jgi:acetyltransferase
MTTRNLEKLFRPSSIAVIGATNRQGSVGSVIMHNLLEGGFEGPILPVNPKHSAVAGVLAYPDVESLPMAPDLAIICTPAAPIPSLIEKLAGIGTRAAIVLTAGLDTAMTPDGRTVKQAMLDATNKHIFRILGPNCLGLLVPGIKLNASFAHLPATDGKIAMVSQSGALCTVILDWAAENGAGFSHFISLGECADVDFGDVIDYLANDTSTRAILLYIESITSGRKFMSACRSAARNKPVIVIKSGRDGAGAKAAASHTGALAGADHVYDAAFRRAGMLRVDEISELFSAVETLTRAKPQKGERLMMMTNGGGLGVIAADMLGQHDIEIPELSEATIATLDKALPKTWSKANPVDIIGDAPGERYTAAAQALLDDPSCDALLVMHAPTAIASSVEAADAVIAVAKNSKKNVLASWAGGKAVGPARKRLREAGIPSYDTPNDAIRGFLDVIEYRRNQQLLMETPASAPSYVTYAPEAARLVVEARLGNGRDLLTEPESKAVLSAYGIATVETHIARSPDEAAEIAEEMGFPVALKILSDDISHKSDVGGVDLFLSNADVVRAAAEDMLKNIGKLMPDAKIQDFTVQRMASRPGAHEVIIGVSPDPVFGPVILFGHGGTAVEVIGDRSVALPPLNMTLARDLISRTRISKLLAGYRDQPPVNMEALCETLIHISQMIVDIPEIQELDINPLLVDEHGVLALDARIRVSNRKDRQGLAIRPYPKNLESDVKLNNGENVHIRPIRPEDEPAHIEFLSKISKEGIRFRFFGQVRDLPHSEMARLTQIDYDREMALIAKPAGTNGEGETLGVVRTVTDPNNERTEFAIIVRSDLKGRGLGGILLRKMIEYCRQRGTAEMVGQVLRDNDVMLALTSQLGFTRNLVPGEEAYEVSLDLRKVKATA